MPEFRNCNPCQRVSYAHYLTYVVTNFRRSNSLLELKQLESGGKIVG